MDRIDRMTEELLQAVLCSDIYQEYLEQEEKLQADPALHERVDRFRAENFRMQQENPSDLFAASEAVSERSAELRKIPEVNAYLEAELAVNRLMQRICGTLAAGIGLNVPDGI